jgi:hypothetical protein
MMENLPFKSYPSVMSEWVPSTPRTATQTTIHILSHTMMNVG